MKKAKFFLLLVMLPLAVIAKPRYGSDDAFGFGGGMPEAKTISKEEGASRINTFRQFHYSGDFSFQFALVHLPARGQEKNYRGVLWGSWNENGHVYRVNLWPDSKNAEPMRLLAQSGTKSKIWIQENGGQIRELTESEMFKPLWEPLIFTPFDLQLYNFLYWKEYEYNGPDRVKGRRAQMFTMYPPQSIKAANPELESVKMAMDEDFNVLLKADFLGNNDQPIRSFQIQNVQKVQDHWIPKRLDIVDEKSKNKNRLSITAAAMGLKLNPSYFNPANLVSESPNVPETRYSRLN